MKKWYILAIVVFIFLLTTTYGLPKQRRIAETTAKKAIQARTFQIHEVKSTIYNLFTGKYRVSLINTKSNEKKIVYIYFDDGIRVEIE